MSLGWINNQWTWSETKDEDVVLYSPWKSFALTIVDESWSRVERIFLDKNPEYEDFCYNLTWKIVPNKECGVAVIDEEESMEIPKNEAVYLGWGDWSNPIDLFEALNNQHKVPLVTYGNWNLKLPAYLG